VASAVSLSQGRHRRGPFCTPMTLTTEGMDRDTPTNPLAVSDPGHTLGHDVGARVVVVGSDGVGA
jgi:hypothetical protein